MIPDFKTFIEESLWSEIQDRSCGKVVRREDDVNLLDKSEFYDYLKNKYKKFHHLIYEDPSKIHMTLGWSYYPKRTYIINLHWVDESKIKKLYLDFGQCELNTLCDKKFKTGSANNGISNKEVLDIIDFCLDYITSHTELGSPLSESLWSEIQDRSAGIIKRKEDDNMESFKEYLENNYELINPYEECQMLSYNMSYTSVGICAFAYKHENDKYLTYYFLNLREDNGKYTLTISKTAQKYKIYDLLRKEYILKDAKTWDYIIMPKDKKTDKKFFFEVLTFILSHIEYPEISIIRKIKK